MSISSLLLGLDVGSTTVKLVILDSDGIPVIKICERHHTDIKNTVLELTRQACHEIGDCTVTALITGSAGLGLSKRLGMGFIQEVIACNAAIERFLPDTDIAIELGGEDAKITYFKNGVEQRMNGICAGGTGAFIDQMAVLLKTDPAGLNALAASHKVIYPIAARCGVFAKSDIQPLLNEGAAREDIAASIFQSVVNQTISGLACGRPIRGKIAFLGGPLHHLPELRQRFKETLKLSDENAICPDDAQFFVAMGAALVSANSKEQSLNSIVNLLTNLEHTPEDDVHHLSPLFTGDSELEAFRLRHSGRRVPVRELNSYSGPGFWE